MNKTWDLLGGNGSKSWFCENKTLFYNRWMWGQNRAWCILWWEWPRLEKRGSRDGQTVFWTNLGRVGFVFQERGMLSEKYLDGFRRWWQLPNVPSSVLMNPNAMDGVTLPRQKGRHVDVVFAALVLMLDTYLPFFPNQVLYQVLAYRVDDWVPRNIIGAKAMQDS